MKRPPPGGGGLAVDGMDGMDLLGPGFFDLFLGRHVGHLADEGKEFLLFAEPLKHGPFVRTPLGKPAR